MGRVSRRSDVKIIVLADVRVSWRLGGGVAGSLKTKKEDAYDGECARDAHL